jgi:flavin reductase (DIM6/NTAB) family NADH-FMN oxidoreductase RutF/DNA-binding MarR family transcriptional regulator
MSTIESGSPTVDSAAFRRCLGQFATGVTVVTTRVGDDLAAMTSNSFASVSLDPPLVLWSIKRSSQSFLPFQSCTHFAVNVLASDQVDLSQKFAKSGPDKFNGVRWSSGAGGAPLLDGAVASFECHHDRDYDGGDHIIMVGQVERFTRCNNREALIFVQGRYATPVDHPMATPTPAVGTLEAEALRLEDESLSSLLVRAYGAVSPTLATARQLEDLTLMQARLMRGIRTFPNRTLASLLPEIFLGLNASEDVLKELTTRGLVAVDGNGVLSLTSEGEKRFSAVLAHARRLESQELSGIPSADVTAVRRVLYHLITRGVAGESAAGR